MKGSLTTRLAWQFATLLTLTTVVVLAAGGWMLWRQSVRSLELLHEVEGAELTELLGKDSRLSGADIHRLIHNDAGSDASLYFIQVHHTDGTVLYRSANMADAILPMSLADERDHRTTTLPGVGDVRVSEFHQGPWHLQIASPLSQISRLLRDYAEVSGSLVFGVALAGVVLGYAFGRVTLRPVREIESTARRIDAHNLRERIRVSPARDELSGLATLLNQMFDRLEGSFEQVKRFTADASHELKTPLALIRLNAERLRARVTNDQEAAAGLDDLMEEIARMNRIIESLLFIAKAESGVLSLTLSEHEVPALLGPFAEDARVLAEDRGVRFEFVRDDAGLMRVEPALLRQLLLNLVGNAVGVSAPGSRVTLESMRVAAGWRLVVADEGPGLPPEHVEKIFERFVRYEHAGASGGGNGLGLAICRSIAELHGGRIRAENREDVRRGLRVIVDLPKRPQAEAAGG